MKRFAKDYLDDADYQALGKMFKQNVSDKSSDDIKVMLAKKDDLPTKLTSDQNLLVEQCLAKIFDNTEEVDQGIFNVVESKLFLLDSCPGVGKTFTIKAIMEKLRQHKLYSTFIVYRQDLLKPFAGFQNRTVCGFLMMSLSMSFDEVKRVFLDGDDVWTTLYKIYILVFTFNSRQRVLILDEYTVVSPWILIFLYWCSLKYKFHLIVSGDVNQLPPINKSKYFKCPNAVILKGISQELTLTKQIRIEDEVLIGLLEEIKNHLNERFTFKIKYKIFETFKDKFYRATNYKAMFITDQHRNIKKRLLELEKREIVRKYPFIVDGDKFIGEHDKFLEYLPVFENFDYFYYKRGESGSKIVTSTVSIVSCHEKYIMVKTREGKTLCVEPDVIFEKRAKKLASFPDDQLSWLIGETGFNIVQFPLVPKIGITAHAIQGLTLTNEEIEIDLDMPMLNALYVAFSRVKVSTQINKIYTKNLYNFIVTLYKNDGYYYKIVANRELKSKLLIWCFEQSDSIVDLPTFSDVNYVLFNQISNKNIRCRRDQAQLQTIVGDNALELVEEISKNIEFFDKPLEFEEFVEKLHKK